MAPSAEVHFNADHPAAAGHFPGNPIIPGALLLDEVVRVLAGLDASRPVCIRAAKFIHKLLPGQSMRVRWQSRDDGAITFECHIADGEILVATGMVEIEQDVS